LLNGQEDVRKIFASYDFFKFVQLMPNAYEVLYRLKDITNPIICSIGTYGNISRKSKWLEKNLPFIQNCILINNGENIMDKSRIVMSNAIFVDDIIENLNSSNATYKICFGKIYSWNKDLPNGYYRALDWNTVEEIVKNIITYKETLVEQTG
jgi:5'(3')-deoxyribonucleotidase